MIDLTAWRASIGLWNCCQIAGTHKPSNTKLNRCIGGTKTKRNISGFGFAVSIMMSLITVTLFLTRHMKISPIAKVYLLLLLLLSGDVELNPGPRTGNTPGSILRSHYANLTDAITTDVYKVTDALHAKELIQTVDHIQQAHEISELIKSSRLVSGLQKLIASSSDPDQYLIDISFVFLNQKNQKLADIAISMLQQCEHVSANPPSSILRSHYVNLTDAITTNIYKITDALYAKGLITRDSIDYIQTAQGISNLLKSSRLISDLQNLLAASLKPDQHLIDICHVLINQQHQTITDTAISMLRQLYKGVHVDVCHHVNNSFSLLLKSYHAKLTDAISTNPDKVADALYAKGLITRETLNYIQTAMGVSDQRKSSRLVFDLGMQFSSSLNPKQLLVDICHVLINQQQTLTDIATSILQHLGHPIPDLIPSDDVERYINILRKLYNDQAIIDKEEWPPKVGKDYFGRLALVEKKNESIHKDEPKPAWYLLRGKIDEIPNIPGYKEITIADILQPKGPLSVVIDGPPGIGKTTLCNKLLNMWSNGIRAYQKYNLVLYCPLRDSEVATATTLENLLNSLYESKSTVPKVADWISDKEGKGLLIIFDGWDELSKEHKRSSLVAKIIRRKKLVECSVIVTSRSYASYSLKIPFPSKHVQVIGFSEKEIYTVIVKACQKDHEQAQKVIDVFFNRNSLHFFDKDKAKEEKFFRDTETLDTVSNLVLKFLNDLAVREDVRSLCYVPLICSMVILTYREKGHLPKTLTELYENFVLQTIRRHVEIKETNYDIEPDTLDSLSSLPLQLAEPYQELCQLAYTNLVKQQMTFSSNQIQSLSTAPKEDYLGLITTFTEYKKSTHQFLHLSIQEFLAAWWIRHNKAEETFKTHFDDDHFRLCLRFVAGLTQLEHDNYQQYFSKHHLDLQCNRRPKFGFDGYYYNWFSVNPMIDNIGIFDHGKYLKNFSNEFPVFLLQLLYESQNPSLCQTLAKFINNASLCLRKAKLSPFDVLCLSYFINNSNKTEWNHLHLELCDIKTQSIFANELINDTKCKVLELTLMACTNTSFHELFQQPLLQNIEEFYCYISAPIGFDLILGLLKVFQLPHLKILLFSEIFTSDKVDHCLELEKCIAKNSKLEVLKLMFNSIKVNQSAIESVVKGVTKNKNISSYSLVMTFMNQSIADCIKDLVKNNRTLKAFSIKATIGAEPISLNLTDMNASLTALHFELDSFRPIAPPLKHTKELKCLLVPRADSLPHHLSFSYLHSLTLELSTADSSIELFTVLKTNTTLKALKALMYNSELFTINTGTSIRDMLKTNTTLQCLEIATITRSLKLQPKLTPYMQPPKIPITFLQLLTNGLQCNISLQQLRVPITSSADIQIFFHYIFQLENLTEVQLDFVPDQLYADVPQVMTSLLNERVLPGITKVLQSQNTIRVLSIWCDYLNDSPPKEELVKQFYEAIFLHPTLEYIEVIRQSSHMQDIFAAQQDELVAKHEQKQPLKPMPLVVV